MQNTIRNFLVAGLIMACVPAITAAPKPAVQGPIAKVQRKLNSQLIKAARAGNARKIKQLVARGADANTKGERVPALMHAISSFDLNTCKALIAAGADVNRQFDNVVKYGKKGDALDFTNAMRKYLADLDQRLKKDPTAKKELAQNKKARNQVNKIYKFLYWSSFKAKVRNFFRRS